MDALMVRCGRYYGDLLVAYQRSGVLVWMIAAGWLLYPVALQTALHPSDAIGLEYWLQGQPVPRRFTSQMLFAGEIAALVALVGLSLLLLGLAVLFYRKAQFSVALWPLAGVLVGVVFNGIWWIGTGYFDVSGALAGLMPLAIMVGCQAVAEQLGQDFVFGPGNRPRYNPGW